ncbi:hypothetical protein ZWY2020_058249 [Hordeum vulgare]|nr:hypothetical protein ZWY2020_058249 [Hordeum vulgare]
MLDKLSPEEAIKFKASEVIVPTEEIAEEIVPSTDEIQEGAPEEITPEKIHQPRQNPQSAHPRIANEVELDKIIDDINAPASLEKSLPVSSESSKVHIPQEKHQVKKMEDDRKQKGGKKLEQNTAVDIPEELYADYCTPNEEIYGTETMAKRNIRL